MRWHPLLWLAIVFATPAPLAAQVDFIGKAPENATETLEFTTVSKHSMKSDALSSAGQTSTSTQFLFKYGEHNDAESFTPVQVSVASHTLDGEFPAPPAGEKVRVVFDSAKPNAKPANEFFEPLFAQQRLLLTSKIAGECGDDGKVYRPRDAQGDVTPEHEQLLGYLNWRMGSMLQQGLKPGDSWVVHQQQAFGSGQVLELDKHFEYVGLDTSDKAKKFGKKLHKFKLKSTDPKLTFGQIPGMTLKSQEMAIEEQSGEMLFNEELARAESATESIKVTGKLVLGIGAEEIVAEMEVDVDGTTKFVE